MKTRRLFGYGHGSCFHTGSHPARASRRFTQISDDHPQPSQLAAPDDAAFFFPPSHDNMLDTTMNAQRGPADQPHQLTHAVLMVTSDSPNVGASVI